MDMLVVGMYGKGNVGLQGLNDIQYKTHYSIWAFFGSPLIIGCDVRNMNAETLKILSNKELIAINQDSDCRQVYKIHQVMDGKCSCYVRNLENGDIAIGIFNFEDTKSMGRIMLDSIGLPESTGKTLEAHNVWTGETFIVKNGTMVHMVDPYGCLVFRCRVIDAV